ncbi:hypothetical protein EG329_001844 [Mollisiaceae sp. DMI_Dod_QoI]|nr:hypothetical protein EG329_001844 [Helotiales sp. DMI_Dod_QoI]
MRLLRLWAAGRVPLPPRFHTDRHVVISALGDIIDAFNSFSIVGTDEELGQPQYRTLVLKYLQKTYTVMVLLAQTMYPYNIEMEWFLEVSYYSQVTGLRDFRFDNHGSYERIKNPTSSGVISDQARVAASCLPTYPQPPVVCRNPGSYGQRILLNHIHPETGQYLLLCVKFMAIAQISTPVLMSPQTRQTPAWKRDLQAGVPFSCLASSPSPNSKYISSYDRFASYTFSSGFPFGRRHRFTDFSLPFTIDLPLLYGIHYFLSSHHGEEESIHFAFITTTHNINGRIWDWKISSILGSITTTHNKTGLVVGGPKCHEPGNGVDSPS